MVIRLYACFGVTNRSTFSCVCLDLRQDVLSLGGGGWWLCPSLLFHLTKCICFLVALGGCKAKDELLCCSNDMKTLLWGVCNLFLSNFTKIARLGNNIIKQSYFQWYSRELEYSLFPGKTFIATSLSWINAVVKGGYPVLWMWVLKWMQD